MRRMLTGLALLAAACAPRGSAQPAAASPPAAAAVVTVPAPPADAAAPSTSTSPADAGAPAVTEAGQAPSGSSADAGVGISFTGKASVGLVDGGLTFDGSFKFGGSSSPAMSPELVVRSALLVHSSDPQAKARARELLLFEKKVDCTSRPGRNTSTPVNWKRGEDSTFTTVSIENGHIESYKGHVEVLRAPTAPGSTGLIKLDPVAGGNVRGGRVPVHVCP